MTTLKALMASLKRGKFYQGPLISVFTHTHAQYAGIVLYGIVSIGRLGSAMHNIFNCILSIGFFLEKRWDCIMHKRCRFPSFNQ